MPGVTVNQVTASNTGQWYVVNTSPPSGSPTTYTVVQGTEAQALALPNGGGISGPYSTNAAATAVANGEPQNSNASTPIPGVDISPGGGITTSNPFSGLAGIANAVAKAGAVFYDVGQAVTDGKMWRSLGWLLLGLLLIAGGIALFAGKQLTPIGALTKAVSGGGKR